MDHEEAVACFEKALEHDPACAMAHWGVAYGIGPNYNKPWEAFDEVDKRSSLERALSSTRAAPPCRMWTVYRRWRGP